MIRSGTESLERMFHFRLTTRNHRTGLFPILYLLLGCMWLVPGFGQIASDHEDVIYLINKSRYRGEIVDWENGDHVRIRTWSGLEIDVPKDMIKRIVQKRVSGTDPRFSRGRLYGSVAMGFGAADAEGSWLLDGAVGYQFHRLALVGLGTGIYLLDTYNGLQCVPLHIEWRAYPFQRRLSPFIGIRSGLCFPWDSNEWVTNRKYLTSYTGQALAGLQLGQLGEASFLLETGYQFNRIHSEQRWQDSKGNPIVHHRSELIQRWLFRIGVIF